MNPPLNLRFAIKRFAIIGILFLTVLQAIAAETWTGRCIGITDGDIGLVDHDDDLTAGRNSLASDHLPFYLVPGGSGLFKVSARFFWLDSGTWADSR